MIAIKEKHYLGKVLRKYKRECYLRTINQWLPAKNHGLILKTDLYEEAYGEDALLPYIKWHGYKVGIDNSRFIQEKASASSKGKFVCVLADLKKLPFKDRSFNLILSTSTIDHCSESMMRDYLKEMLRVLDSSGNMIISVNNRHNFLFLFANKFETVLGTNKLRTEFYTISELENIFKECGFRKEETGFAFFIPPFSKHAINLAERLGGGRLHKSLLSLVLLFDSFVKERSVLKKWFSHWLIFKLSKA